MKGDFKSISIRVMEIFLISITVVLLIMFFAPILFPGEIAKEVKIFANKKLDGELNFTDARLSFFNHFPSLTVTLTDFSLKGSPPYPNQELIASEEVAFGINVKRLLFNQDIKIDNIFVTKADIKVLVDEKGNANYNVYVSDKKLRNDGSTTSLRLEKIDIEDSHVVYIDHAARIAMEAKGFNYTGKGNLNAAIFDLATEAKIDSFDLYFKGEEYLKNKRVDADLITKINTNSLEFILQQNDLVINKLPVECIGRLSFLKKGYEIDFLAFSENSNLNDFFTALPPQYVQWLEKTKVKGKTDLMLTFKGKYIASEDKRPDLAIRMNVRDGYVSYNKSPYPMSNLRMKLKAEMPALRRENLIVDLDTLFFNIEEDFFGAKVHSIGLKNMALSTSIKAKVDLAKVDRSVGIENMDFQGILTSNLKAQGVFNRERRLFPKAEGFVNLEKGKLQTKYYPNPLENIKFQGKVLNTKGTFEDLYVAIAPAEFLFEGNPVYFHAILNNFDDINYDIKAKGEMDVGRIYKVFAQEGINLKGHVKADVHFKGRQSYATSGQYDKLDNKGTLDIREIVANTKYFPKPFVINKGQFRFHQEKMWFDTFLADYGQSDFQLNGYLLNAINFVLADKGVLKGNFSTNSNYINVDEFMAESAVKPVVNKDSAVVKQVTVPKGVVLLPVNVDLSLASKAKKVSFRGLDLDNLNGNVGIANGKMNLGNTTFGIIGSKMMLEGAYDDINSKKAVFNMHFVTKNFDVKKAYNEIKLFRDLVTAAEKAEGIVSVDYKLNGVLNDHMRPIMPSLEGQGVIAVKKVKLRGFKILGSVSRKTNSAAVNDPDLNDFDIKTSIKNNVITVKETKLKVSIFHLKFKGETNFDGQLNLKMRLGLPPFGLIGIPMVLTGTHENPKLKAFSKTGQEVEETEYEGSKPVPVAPKATSNKEATKEQEEKK